jgi:hypothetical protein
MPTFLTTPKMSPELAARVETSVTGRPAGRGKMSPMVISALRFCGLAGRIGIVVWIVVVRRQANAELEADRNGLLAQLNEDASQATDADKAIVSRIEAWAGKHTGAYEGDVVDDSVRGAGMSATLARPIIYLRGPLEGFSSPKGIADMRDTTYRDAFVLCLFDPPSKRSEKSLREAARAVLLGGERMNAVAHVTRFHTARVGLPYLAPQWAERVQKTDSSRDLADLRSALKRVSLKEAVHAMKARLLLIAMDEPKDGTAPTEIDGANRHYVRVTLLDLETDKVLLQQRKLVDPGWIPVAKRGEYTNGINSCELGLEIRAVMTGTAPPERE